MDQPNCTVRRANVDDLAMLMGLWEIARLPAAELERHLTEFQVLTRPDGILVGAVGLRMGAGQGWLHSEAFYSPEHEDDYRPFLWERLQVLARNHGVSRLWTRERAPFWRQAGFNPATPEDLKRFPAAFGDAHAVWMTVQLREERLPVNLEKEFELFQMSQREASDRILRQAKIMKWIAGAIAAAFGIAALVLLATIMRKGLPHPPR